MKLIKTLLVFSTMACVVGAATFAGAAKDVTPEIPKQVTFAKDVAPIFHANCVSGHRPGDIAPMALRTYDEARPWAKSIGKALRDGSMPPWHADAAYGDFSNDRSLTEVERQIIVKWVKQGSPAAG
ncbi:MAG: hypothetical protein VYE73_06300 [Acidobacteriota bacterium]|nr:hypothetical protein [Acidobacteriota bacterium]